MARRRRALAPARPAPLLGALPPYYQRFLALARQTYGPGGAYAHPAARSGFVSAVAAGPVQAQQASAPARAAQAQAQRPAPAHRQRQLTPYEQAQAIQSACQGARGTTPPAVVNTFAQGLNAAWNRMLAQEPMGGLGAFPATRYAQSTLPGTTTWSPPARSGPFATVAEDVFDQVYGDICYAIETSNARTAAEIARVAENAALTALRRYDVAAATGLVGLGQADGQVELARRLGADAAAYVRATELIDEAEILLRGRFFGLAAPAPQSIEHARTLWAQAVSAYRGMEYSPQAAALLVRLNEVGKRVGRGIKLAREEEAETAARETLVPAIKERAAEMAKGARDLAPTVGFGAGAAAVLVALGLAFAYGRGRR